MSSPLGGRALLHNVVQRVVTSAEVPPFRASGAGSLLMGGNIMCAGRTWPLGTCMSMREVALTGDRQPQALQHVPQIGLDLGGADTPSEPYTVMTLWIEGPVDTAQVLRYVAEQCRVNLKDVSFSCPSMLLPTLEGSVCFRICMPRPSLYGIVTVNTHSALGAHLDGNTKIAQRVQIGDLASAAAPLAWYMDADQLLRRRTGAAAAVEVEGCIVVHNLTSERATPQEILSKRAHVLKTYGMLNYFAVHPWLAMAADTKASTRDRVQALVAYGLESSERLLGVCGEVSKGVEVKEALAHFHAYNTPHVGYAPAVAVNVLEALSDEASAEEALVHSGVDLTALAKMVEWNHRANKRAASADGAFCRPGDEVLVDGRTVKVRTPQEARQFSLADVVIHECALREARRVVVLPWDVEVVEEASPYLRLVTDPEKQKMSAAPASWCLRGQSDMENLKILSEGAQPSNQSSGHGLAPPPSVGLRMRLPASSHIYTAAASLCGDITPASELPYEQYLTTLNRLVSGV